MANTMLAHSYLVMAGPLLSFMVNGLWLGRRRPDAAGLFSTVLAGATFLLSLATAFAYRHHGLALASGPGAPLTPVSWDWLNITPELTARMGVLLDPISVMMIIVIGAVGFVVHIYSLGYMKDEPGRGRFFALLSLFVFSMQGLVLASGLFQMFVFWELVGVSSYCLIGFYYQRPTAVAAAKKAFIVTRLADAFFLLGIIVAGTAIGSFDFAAITAPAAAAILNRELTLAGLSVNLLTLATVLIFIGGWGKSAMFPLHVWLPDAMEGPTPVSAIIHSATMVVAGVFLTARMFPLFAAAPFTLDLIRFVGAFTALFAAVVAITQTDIKRILAFSTLSQLGYMMFSLGAAATSGGLEINPAGFQASMFHIFTHAFFKCMLFLGAGAVIHAVHDNDLSRMGGLRRQLPWTYWSMLAACLAIAGVFPFSGFWSKDDILLAAWQSGHYPTFGIGLVTGGLTAFYMFRFFFRIFHGPASGHAAGHEDPLMTVAIVALVPPTIISGLAAKGWFDAMPVPALAPTLAHAAHLTWLPYAASLVGLGGIFSAWLFYGRPSLLAERCRNFFGPLYSLAWHKFYVDELYLLITKRVIFECVAAPIKWVDRQVVDGAVNLTSKILLHGGDMIRRAHSGRLPLYCSVTVMGLVLLFLCGDYITSSGSFAVRTPESSEWIVAPEVRP